MATLNALIVEKGKHAELLEEFVGHYCKRRDFQYNIDVIDTAQNTNGLELALQNPDKYDLVFSNFEIGYKGMDGIDFYNKLKAHSYSGGFFLMTDNEEKVMKTMQKKLQCKKNVEFGVLLVKPFGLREFYAAVDAYFAAKMLFAVFDDAEKNNEVTKYLTDAAVKKLHKMMSMCITKN